MGRERNNRSLLIGAFAPLTRATHKHWAVLGAGLIAVGGALGIIAENSSRAMMTDDDPARFEFTFPLQLPPHQQDATSGRSLADQWHTFTVQAGDSLSTIFSRAGLSQQQVQEVLTLGSAMSGLKKLYPGDQLKFKVDPAGTLQALVYELDVTKTLMIERAAGELKTNTIEHPVETRTAHATGVIDSSLFAAGHKAGMSDGMVLALANIFGYDIDFALDLREGDRFAVVYEEQFANGEKYRDGAILAAEFVNGGKTYRAVRYTSADGESHYYTPDGRGLRKAFLRTPVEFSRISSGFSLRRYHPVLNRFRAHKGVDYAAPTGTPVRATADGRVNFRGVKGGYGNVIEVQHGRRYSTLYGHLSRFASGLRQGDRVRQGQVIGFVGMTGLASGPHLHYEFRVDNVHRDPLKVALPQAELDSRERAAFNDQVAPALAQLDTLTRAQVATNAPR